MPAASLTAATFALGADVGWLSQMEASGIKFYNSAGTPQDCLQVLQGVGIDSIRLRVWVNPAGGWCGQDDVVKMAVRAKNQGQRIMIDFHYSDFWADPGKQNKPAAWLTHDFNQLRADVESHTAAVLTALKSAGVTPEWVQVGNETNDGMLWNDGRASITMGNFAALVTSGYNGVKSVFPSAKVIVHISNGYDSSLFRWMFDGLTTNGAKYDVIAMSLYPTASNWATLNSQCLANMTDMVARYGKEVIISEVGMSVSSAAACKSFLADLIAKTKSLPDGKGLGVFYWEPESYNRWQGYAMGAFGNDGRPTQAMDAFAEAAVPTLTVQPQVAATKIVSSGSTAVFTVNATGSPAPTYQWRKDDANIPGETNPTLVVQSATAASAGAYSVVVTNTSGSMTSAAGNLAVVPSSDPGRLTNFSVLTDLTTAVPSFIVGTVIGGAGTSGTKPLVVRAAGPALDVFGVPGPLGDPRLELYTGQTVAASNDNWNGDAALATAMASVGAFAYASPTSKDAAIFNAALPARDYSVAVSGVGGSTGTVLAEIYDATPAGTFTATTPRLINLSVLKQINAGGSVTLGFTIGGATAKTVLIRAIGPGLAGVGVTGGTLADPQLTLYNNNDRAVIASNNGWGGGLSLTTTGARVSAFAIASAASKDAMLLLTLNPGGYSATANSSGGGGGGLAIVEVYEVP